MGAGKHEWRRLRELGCGHANLHQDPGAITQIDGVCVLVHVCARCEHIVKIIWQYYSLDVHQQNTCQQEEHELSVRPFCAG
jgi:hypothetical protein